VIAIVNYGSGNIQAIANIYHRLEVPFVVAATPAEIAGADRVILPGVGAFDQCMNELDASGMRQALDRWVLEERKPILGICVGMQLLAKSSEEGSARGLGWIDAEVRKFDPALVGRAVQLPHMGWNSVEPAGGEGLFAGVEPKTGFYFLHSYYFACHEPAEALATTEYGVTFTSAVRRGNVYGVQFHPEKSHHNGVRLLRNFAELPA
jgi:imidazole glycerol-phosphate synthase subunit HisH